MKDRFTGGLKRKVDTKNRFTFPAKWKGQSKDFFLWVPKKGKLIKELQTSKQKILGILARTEEPIQGAYGGDNYLDDIYSNLFEIKKSTANRIQIPKEAAEKMKIENQRIDLVGCVEYIAIIQGKVEDSIDEE